MQETGYRTAPLASPHLPPGIPYIIGNEAAERFSFYGMKAILVTYMTTYLLNAEGVLAGMSEGEAKGYFHLFVSTAYFCPLIGAWVADVWLGKYRTILWFSLVYCCGHAALAADQTRLGLFAGLALIGLGAGGIKPCVSAHVGDQFGKTNQHLIKRVFEWFYFSINFGSAFATMITPWLLRELPGWLALRFPRLSAESLERVGPHTAFGLPGVMMFLATVVFWMGRKHFVHIPPRGKAAVLSALSGDTARALASLLPIYACVAIFWSLYDQTGSTWVQQAKHMDRVFLGVNWMPEQIQTINPLLILIFIPLSSFVVYPALERVVRLTPLRKIGAGLFLIAGSFVITALVQHAIDRGATPSIGWQFLAYMVLTAAEVLVSITCLEFSYTQAPPESKSFVMSLYLLAISLGNGITSVISFADRFSKAGQIWFFVGLMLLTSVVYMFVAMTYRDRTYLQPEEPAGK